MPRLADPHCSVQLFTAQGRDNPCVDGDTVGSNCIGDLGQNGWLPATLLASLSDKEKEMSF